MRRRMGGDNELGTSHGLGLPVEPRQPPSPPDAFEFAPALGSADMCAAEDVFLRGRLVPYNPLPTSPPPTRRGHQLPTTTAHHGREHKKRGPSVHMHRGPDSLDGYARPSRGGGYRKGRGGALSSADCQRLPAVAEACGTGAAERSGASSPRPSWCVLAFGSPRLPSEISMRDIKRRLMRRRSLFSTAAGSEGDGINRAGITGGAAPREKTSSRGRIWKLLRSLTCKGDVAGVVEAWFTLGLTRAPTC